MHRQLPQFVLAFVTAVLTCVGCGSSSIPTSPSAAPIVAIAPAAVPPPGALQTYTLSGVVFEVTPTGQVPVEAVEVYCDSCGSPVGHTFAYTDAQGFYSVSWAQNGVHSLLVRKAGYDVIARTRTLADGTGVANATVNGDTRFDIQIVRR